MSDTEEEVRRAWKRERAQFKGRGIVSLLPEEDLRRTLEKIRREKQTPGVVSGQFSDAEGDSQDPTCISMDPVAQAEESPAHRFEPPKMWQGLLRDSPCPAPFCVKRDRKLKKTCN